MKKGFQQNTRNQMEASKGSTLYFRANVVLLTFLVWLITDNNVKQQIWVWCISHFMYHSCCSFSKCRKLLNVFPLDLENKGRIFISLNVSYKGWNQSKHFTLAFFFLFVVTPTPEMITVNHRKLWVRQHLHLLKSHLRRHFNGNEKEINQRMLHLLICLFIAFL